MDKWKKSSGGVVQWLWLWLWLLRRIPLAALAALAALVRCSSREREREREHHPAAHPPAPGAHSTCNLLSRNRAHYTGL